MKFQGSIEFSIIENTNDRVVSEMPIRPGIKNPFGVVHVGAIIWLADVTATILVMGPGAQACFIRWSYVSPVGVNPVADGILKALESMAGGRNPVSVRS